MIMDSSASSSSHQYTTSNFQEPLQLPTSPSPSFFDPLPSFLPTTCSFPPPPPPPPPSTTSQTLPAVPNHQNSRQIKKRTRASRRAPTTVLTTDTSNFRQMVQEFTGFPTPPFSPSSSSRPPNNNNNLPYFLNRTTSTVPPININPFLNPHNNNILASAHALPPQFADLSSLLIPPPPSLQPMQQLWNDVDDENINQQQQQQSEKRQKTASESWNANSSHQH